MPRSKPKEPIHQSYGGAFDAMCRTAGQYWQLNTLPAGEDSPIVVVELLAQDIRVAVRLLAEANAIRRFCPAKLVVLIGPDPFWRDVIWSYYDPDRLTDIAKAYGADEIIDIGEWVREEIGGRRKFSWLGGDFEVRPQAESRAELYLEISDATHTRALRVPRITDEIRASNDYRLLERRCLSYARIYDRMFGQRTLAFVTSHVDYHQWGYAVDACMRNNVPVVHVQSTGSLKAYTLFPETMVEGYTYRMNMAEQIGDFFERHIWSHRSVLTPMAELVAWRSKSNFGRPSWWRGGMSSLLSFR